MAKTKTVEPWDSPEWLVPEMIEVLKLAERFRKTPIVDDDFCLMRDRFDCALGNILRRLREKT